MHPSAWARLDYYRELTWSIYPVQSRQFSVFSSDQNVVTEEKETFLWRQVKYKKDLSGFFSVFLLHKTMDSTVFPYTGVMCFRHRHFSVSLSVHPPPPLVASSAQTVHLLPSYLICVFKRFPHMSENLRLSSLIWFLLFNTMISNSIHFLANEIISCSVVK